MCMPSSWAGRRPASRRSAERFDGVTGKRKQTFWRADRLTAMKNHNRLYFGVLTAAAAWALCATAAHAASGADDAQAQARYQAERAHCLSGLAHQSQDNCLEDARNAYADIRKGRIASVEASTLEANRLRRCEAHQGEDRADCEARMRGLGTTQGSVEAGGVLLEYRKTVPAQ